MAKIVFDTNEDGSVTVTQTYPDIQSAMKSVSKQSDDRATVVPMVEVHREDPVVKSVVDGISHGKLVRIKQALLEMRGMVGAKVLAAIVASSNGIASDLHLREVLTGESNEPFNLAPAFSNISKTLKRHDLEVSDIYDREKRRQQGKTFVWYRLHSDVISIINSIVDFEMGGPVTYMKDPFEGILDDIDI